MCYALFCYGVRFTNISQRYGYKNWYQDLGNCGPITHLSWDSEVVDEATVTENVNIDD